MPSKIFLIVSLLSLAFLAAGFFAIAYLLSSRVPARVRLNMDEIPAALSKLWWLVDIFHYYLVPYLPQSWITRRQKLLSSAGLEFFLMAEESYALQGLCASVPLLLVVVFFLLSDISLVLSCVSGILMALLGWCYPVMWLRDQKKKRVLIILKSMPAFLDILTLCCECGLTLNAGLSHYCDKGPKGPLRNELERAVRDMKGGATRVEALMKLGVRMGNPDMTMFVSIVAQCEKLGVPLGEVLRRFSEQKRTERFQRAEKLAMEAPMKIIGPLVLFIFPITFIIIAFPIAISLMENLR